MTQRRNSNQCVYLYQT